MALLHALKPGERNAAFRASGRTGPRSDAPSDGREVVLVYRDQIVPRSEVNFLRRQYVGFEHLKPVWVGCRAGPGLEEFGVEPLLLGRGRVLGIVERLLFKQFGLLPPRPDLAALRPGVVHAHFGKGGAFALPLARALHVPLVVTFHGSDATKEKHYQRRLLPTIYQRRLAALQHEAALFICVSESIRDRLIERGFPPEKLRIIRYGVDTEHPAAPAPPPRQPYVLFVGRFVEKKGITHLIEAMRWLESRGAGVTLALIGDGPLAGKLKEQARFLGKANFLGWLPPGEVRRWMRGAVAVCVPSVTAETGDMEGLPNVVLEAMAEGVPVIGARNAGIGEAVEHGRTGLLVPPGDAGAIAEAIARLAGEPELRRAMGEAARSRAAERFSAVAQSHLLEEALLSVMHRAGSSGMSAGA